MVEPGAATYAFKGIAGPAFKCFGRCWYGYVRPSRLLFLAEDNSAERGLRELQVVRIPPVRAVSLGYVASESIRPAVLTEGPAGSAVVIAVVAPRTSSSVGRVLGNRDSEGRRCCFLSSKHKRK